MKLVTFIFCLLLCVSTVSAFEFDNVKDYDPYTKTATITNAFGLGDTIAEIKLESEPLEYVHRGYNKVAQFEVRNYGDYDNALDLIEFYNKRGMQKINRQYDFKYWGEVQEEVREYETVCGDGTYDKELDWIIPNCNTTIKSKSYKTVPGWADLESINLKENDVLTIAIFTDVQKGDYVEWIPTFYGEKINEWATWTESLAVDLAEFINCSSTQAMISSANDLVATGTPEFTSNLTSFGIGASCFTGTNEYWTINNASYWNLNTSADISLGGWIYRGAGQNIAMGKSNIASGGWDMGYHSSDYVFVRGISNGDFLQSETGAMVAGSWFYVMITRNSTNTVMYVNGTRESSATAETPPGASAMFELGLNTASGEDYVGYFDEWGFWTRDLLPSEIVDLYNEGVGLTYNPFPINPDVDLVFPENETYGVLDNPTMINYTYTDVDECWYSLDNGVTNSTPPILAGTNFTGLTASEGGNFWKVWCNDSFDTLTNDTVHFTLDTTTPTVDFVLPNLSINYHKKGNNITVNWSTWDLHPEPNCFLGYEGTNTTYPCSDNTTFINGTHFNNRTVYLYANDTLGNLNSGVRSWDYKIFEHNRNFNATTTESLVESFMINVTYNDTSYSSITAMLYFNGTGYPTTAVTDEENVTFTRALTIPIVPTKLNHTLWWEFTLTNATANLKINSTNDTQQASNFNIDDCTAEASLLYNFTVVDELTQAIIVNVSYNVTGEVDMQIYTLDRSVLVANFSHFYYATSFSICTSDNLTNGGSYSLDAQIKYDADEYATEFYHIQNHTLVHADWTTNITLYDLDNTTSQQFKITYKNKNFLAVENALIKVLRKYISEGVSKIVEIPKTDSNGETLAHLEIEDAIYTFIVEKNGEILATFNNIIAQCQLDNLDECIINLNALSSHTELTDWRNYRDFSYTLTYDDPTREIESVWSIPSGSVATVTLNATLYDQIGNIEACHQISTDASGTLSCIVPLSFGNSTIRAELIKDGDMVGYSLIRINEDPKDIYGSNIVFLGLFLFLTLIGIGISNNPMITGVFLLIGVILAIGLNLVDTTNYLGAGATILWLLIVIVVILIKGANR